MIVTDGLLCDLDPPRVERGHLRIEGDRIVERGSALPARAGDERINAGGAVVLPGLVNGHTHLYSALAVGMPPPPEPPRNFREILERVWWRLDRALDARSIETSAIIGALDAVRCGTTTLIDHHASPNCIDGSLDVVERALQRVGVRGVLCYETTDRHGRAGREAGLAENRRYIKRRASATGGRFAGLVGAHASFTLDDDALDALAALAEECGVGVHLHVAEDPCDEQDAQRRGAKSLIERLAGHRLLSPRAIFAHGTHLDAAAAARVSEAQVTLAHNPRSNMNNAVGYAPLGAFRGPVMLGTDGIGGDLFAEVRAAWLIARHERAALTPGRIVEMLAVSARRASECLGVTVGRLQPGAAADVLITDYVPAGPLHDQNLAGHLLFGLSSRHIRHVLVAGRTVVRDRCVMTCDEAGQRAAAGEVARRLWERMVGQPP